MYICQQVKNFIHNQQLFAIQNDLKMLYFFQLMLLRGAVSDI